MNTLEAVAAALIVVNVVLVARRSILAYPVAIVAVALYADIFFDARLYSDFLLQFFFIAVNIYGWAKWWRAKRAVGDIVVVTLPWRQRFHWIAAIAVLVLAWGAGMHLYTNAALPWWDAGIAITSIVAQILQARRAIESWVLWILVDLASVPLYAVKSLWITCALYVLLLGIAIVGLIQWRRAMAAARRL